MSRPVDVTAVRLYCKSPGSAQLRKGAAAELASLEAAGWVETHRTIGFDHVVVRLERPHAVRQGLHLPQGGPARGRR
ncbi:MAG TPA: hypothetical protein VHL53_00555 [Acidimicrobiia bacterium]|nr:hypothetical protein [Acidimicrobiia bacterium]